MGWTLYQLSYGSDADRYEISGAEEGRNPDLRIAKAMLHFILNVRFQYEADSQMFKKKMR